MNPLLSVIVPVYNTEPYLRKCVDSILTQTYRNLEILLVDDGSQDGSPQICDDYARQDSRDRVFHKENGGQSLARNLALDVFQGDYVTFVDSDDWLEPDTYEAMIALALRTRAGTVCCGRYNVSECTGEKKQGLCPQKEELLSAEEMLGRMFTWQGCDCAPCDKIFKREVFEKLRFPEKSGFEDILLLYQLVLLGKTAALLPKPCYNYLQRKGSTSYGAVTPRIFQYPANTEQVLKEISQVCPAVRKQACFLRIRSLSWVLLLLDQTDKSQREHFYGEMKVCRKALRGLMGEILTSPWLKAQERITDLLLCINWYRPIRKLVHRD